MAEITVELIKTLRDKTNAGMMDCKAALVEAQGDLEAAETVLRKKGIADADKKAGRAAKEGVCAARLVGDGKAGVLVEVNCETDFVAKNEKFGEFVEAILDHISASPSVATLDELLAQPFASEPGKTLEVFIKEKVGQLGENLGLGRFAKYEVAGEGLVGSYIHMAGRVGVLVELAFGKADTAASPAVAALLKDLCMHIAAAHPICVRRDEVPTDKVEAERDIFREQMKGKPAEIIEKIIDGKLGKFYSINCLLDQPFIKDNDKTIQALLDELSKASGDTVTVVRFHRFAVGEEVAA